MLIPEDGESINLCSNVSINELRASTGKIGVSPNPFRDLVEFKVPGTLLHIRVLDLNGRLITTLYEPRWNGTNADGLVVHPGLYVVFVSTSEGFYTERILKQ